MSKIDEVKAGVAAGKTKVVPGLVQEALNEGQAATAILEAMVEAMGVVGDKFSSGEIFVPEMLVAGKAMQKGVEVLKPVLAGSGAVSLGKCIIGTVAGDLHDIGKNLVALMIGSAGFDVIDLGVDVPADKFIETIKANPDVKVVACSALLTTTMPAMKETVETIKASGLTGFKVLVGGAPITPEFASSIGADAYARDAGGAAVKAKELV
ncbi:methionine synthase [Oxobacter pfennigii]|uniref:Methionine synthase n=1 Tax=Oxobacter pfennigii TaxID=36849 RepID=A0A0P9AII0_9CLOT|nr:corrinoid protein [Oxobacter pfennigii]KPU45271.1 methionine synthase [Oxobacter pfennigii]